MVTVSEVYDSMTAEEFGPNDVFTFYKDPYGDYRWRRKSPNGDIVGMSSEGYKNSTYSVKNAIRNGMKKSHKYRVEY